MADPIFGPLLSVLADTKERPLYLSDDWKKALDDSALLLGEQRGQNKANLADFESGLTRARGQIEPLAQQDIGTLGGTISNLSQYSPFGGLQQVGNQYIDWGKEIAKNVADYGSSRVKLADAGLYGGRGGGSYGTNLLLNNVTRNLAPVWANMLSLINPSYLAQQQDRAMQLQQLTNAMNQRRAIPLETANLALAPIQARQQALMGELGAGGAAADALRKLYRGSEVKQNWAGKALNQVNAVNDSILNTATSLAGDAVAAYTGGMAGGGGTKTPAVSPQGGGGYMPNQTWGAVPPPYYGQNSIWGSMSTGMGS